MKLNKEYHQKTPKNRTDLLKKKSAVIKRTSSCDSDLSEAGETHPLLQGLKNSESLHSSHVAQMWRGSIYSKDYGCKPWGEQSHWEFYQI